MNRTQEENVETLIITLVVNDVSEIIDLLSI